MADKNITAEIIQKNIVTAEIVEKAIIEVNFSAIDIVNKEKIYLTEIEDVSQQTPYAERQVWIYSESENAFVNKSLTELLEYYIKIEAPTKIGAKTFQLTHDALSGTLLVFLNGIEENHYAIINDNTFEFTGSIDSDDTVRVKYYRK